MKNLKNIVSVIVLALFMFAGHNTYGQFKIEGFLTASKKIINTKQANEDTKEFAKFLPKSTSNNDIFLINLKNGYKILQYNEKNLTKNIVKLKNDKYLIFYTKDIDKKKTAVYDQNLNLLYYVIYDGKKVKYIIPSKNAFLDCMHAAEDAVADGFLGWIAWEYSPGVKLAAAIYCATQ